MKDQNELKECDREATAAFLKGGGTSGRGVFYKWNSPDRLIDVTISSLEKKTTIGGGFPQISSDSVAILIDHNSTDPVRLWGENINRIKKEFENDKNKKTKSDF